nr:reverse transcriptase domain-containing protein [Tanacetum cinerariifolium]
DWHQPTSQQSSHRNHDHNNDRHGSDRRGVPVMDVTRGTGVSSPTDMPIMADKKPGASGRVFSITEGHAANTSGAIMGTIFIYGHAVFVLFDTGATHSVISSA